MNTDGGAVPSESTGLNFDAQAIGRATRRSRPLCVEASLSIYRTRLARSGRMGKQRFVGRRGGVRNSRTLNRAVRTRNGPKRDGLGTHLRWQGPKKPPVGIRIATRAVQTPRRREGGDGGAGSVGSHPRNVRTRKEGRTHVFVNARSLGARSCQRGRECFEGDSPLRASGHGVVVVLSETKL